MTLKQIALVIINTHLMIHKDMDATDLHQELFDGTEVTVNQIEKAIKKFDGYDKKRIKEVKDAVKISIKWDIIVIVAIFLTVVHYQFFTIPKWFIFILLLILLGIKLHVSGHNTKVDNGEI